MVSEDRSRQILLLLNRSASEPLEARVTVEGFEAATEATVETVAGEGILQRNEWEAPDAIRIEGEGVKVEGGTVTLTLKPHSVNVVTLAKQ